MARREERAYRAYASEEQRSQAGCIGVQMARVFVNGSLVRVLEVRRGTAGGEASGWQRRDDRKCRGHLREE